MAPQGDFGPGATLRPLHFTVTVVDEDEDGQWRANGSTGLVAEVVAADGRVLVAARSFEVDLTPEEQAAADSLVARLLAGVVADEGLAGTFTPAAEEAPASA